MGVRVPRTSVLLPGSRRPVSTTHVLRTEALIAASRQPHLTRDMSGVFYGHIATTLPHTSCTRPRQIIKRHFSHFSPPNTSRSPPLTMEARLQAVDFRGRLAAAYPWTTSPLIVGAPMRVMSGPELAVAVSRAGGFGFIGPGLKPESTGTDLETAKELLASSSIPGAPHNLLPLGVGFQIWNGDVEVSAAAVSQYRPAAAWLFAPRNGQGDVDVWTQKLREASPETKIWLQIGTLQEGLDAARSASAPDVLVVQGAEAGGHGRASDGTGFITLLPEIADATKDIGIPLIAAGGIADGRGVAAALGVGAAGITMGTRFLASQEARIKKGYQDEVVRATDGGANTLRTQLYNHLRGTFGWPEQFSPRTIVNQSWREKERGTSFEEIKKKHDDAVGKGDAAWGPDGWTATYAGANIGLVTEVAAAGEIVDKTRSEARNIIQALSGGL